MGHHGLLPQELPLVINLYYRSTYITVVVIIVQTQCLQYFFSKKQPDINYKKIQFCFLAVPSFIVILVSRLAQTLLFKCEILL